MRIPTIRFQLICLAVVPLFIALTQVTTTPPTPPMPDYAAAWKSADSLMARGLPQSALAIADRVYTEAKRTGNEVQLLKAAMRRVVFRTNAAADETTYLTMIQALQADIDATNGPTRSVLQSVLAQVYGDYFRRNRYKFYSRTPTAQASPAPTDTTANDPRTWDARRLQQTITSLYVASVQDAARLQKTPIDAYDAVINDGNPAGRPLRPTLFDVLAHRAIGYFNRDDADALRPIQAFTANDPMYLASPETFAALTLPTTDTLSGTFQALRLYQQLLTFHRTDVYSLAYSVNDLERLVLVRQRSALPAKNDLYRQTLTKQIARYKGQAAGAVAEAEYTLALVQSLAGDGEAEPGPIRHYGNEPENDAPIDTARHWNRKQAADLARDLIARFPNTIPAQTARNLLANLLRSTLRVEVEEVNEPGKLFRARVQFLNTKTLFYRVLRLTAEEARTIRQYDDFSEDPKRDKWFARLQGHTVVADSQLTLPDDGDLRSHSVEVPMPALPVGYYALLVSNEGKWAKPSAETGESVSVGTFAVSRLGYLLAGDDYQFGQGDKVVYMTDRMTGQPLANVSAQLFGIKTNPTRSVTPGKTYQTDAQGKLTVRANDLPENEACFLRLTQASDVLDTDVFYGSSYQLDNQNPEIRHTAIFTDRAIYRPGQLVHWKALLYAGKDNQYAVVPNADIVVRLIDVNGQEVSKVATKTNEFGSAAGTFTAPVGRLTGRMTISAQNGGASIQVEEYKRPTFTVVADSLKQAVVLGQTVPVRAVAKTLAGATLEGATVSYRVSRTYYQPYWGWWRPFQPSGNEQEIASGTATTDADGAARFTFVAQPDASIAASTKPQFTYTVTIDVTDPSGETRSTTQSLRIGYTALTAELRLPSPVLTTEPQPYVVRLTNASGIDVKLAGGSVAIARLTPPRPALRTRLWAKTDRNLLSRDAYVAQFPLDLYGNEDDPATWARTPVRTTRPDAVTLTGLTSGLYVADVVATDAAGQSATQTVFFEVINPQQPTAPVRPGTFVQVQKATAEPGEEAVFWVGTSLATAARPDKVLMNVEKNGKSVRQEWLTVTGQPLRVAVPVAEADRGGFSVQFALVQNGRLLTELSTVKVPFTSKQLTITTETFRDKLKPGQPEQWTLRLSGPKQDKVMAELAATLYDASLDAFARLEWPTSIYQKYGEDGSYWSSPAFGTTQTQTYWSKEPANVAVQVRRVPELGWGPYEYDVYRGRFINRQPQMLGSVTIRLEQTGKVVVGRVAFEDGQTGIAAVQIQVKGTSIQIGTDEKGAFRLTLPAASKKPVLVFSLIGFRRTEVPLTGKKVIKALMAEDHQALNEVVVVGYGTKQARDVTGAVARLAAPMAMARKSINAESDEAASAVPPPPGTDPASGREMTPPLIRKNFNETAFFFPQLQTDAQGRVVLTFTMPDALTRWRLVTFAHTKTMQTGTLEREVVTQKELMVTTNVPRFFRENDTLRLTARIDNLSGKALNGVARLTITDALTGEPLNAAMLPGVGRNSLPNLNQSFALSGNNTVVSWQLVVPTGLPPVTLRVTAEAGNFTDGEERVVPVLPNRTLVTDVQPFWINGGDKDRTFRLRSLADHNPELPLNTERLTVEVTSNPAWYSLQSLPYLMEYSYDCAEQLFSKLYANSLGAHILNSRPAFRQVVDSWRQNPPKSPLASNDELKAVTLENTPWLIDAKSETERTARLGQFFEKSRLVAEQRRAIDKLSLLQSKSGGLAWFAGMMPSLNMSLHVLAGMGHLRQLGVKLDPSVQAAADSLVAGLLRYADDEIDQRIADERVRARQQKTTMPTPYWGAQYLYARSFYLNEHPVEKTTQTYLLTALTSGWQQASLQSQALAASTLYRFGMASEARAILQSLTERSKVSDELGMYWPENREGTFWYQAPIETQAYLIEAYTEACQNEANLPKSPVPADCFAWLRKQPQHSGLVGAGPFIDKMRQWLVQEKRTQSWPSTKATTEAVYALLMRGTDGGSSWLDTKATTTVLVGGKDIASRVTKTEALTGYQKVTYAPAEVTPAQGVITVQKQAKTGPSWGAAYWQHFEPLDAIGAAGTNLTVTKTLFRQRNSNAGPVLEAITPKTVLKPGDLLKVRVVLTADRNMEYVHLQDGRASGFEPVAVLSGTKYQNGMAYYEASRDASTDFFIEYLPTGTHVFEYALRVVHTGDFGAGLATVQCFYAPEFAAHSSAGRVQVK